MPDGKRIVFVSQRDGAQNLYWQPADGTASAERLTQTDNGQLVTGTSPDGSQLVFHEGAAEGMDLMVLSLAADRTVRPLVRSPFTERNGVVSPDGRWVAYESDGSGRLEIRSLRRRL
jgi:eukaryotic-like serine/threonine-protein kinase